MPRSMFALCLLLLSSPVVAEKPPASQSPSLDYIELLPFSYLEESESALPFRREGEGAGLRLSWTAGDYIAINGRARMTQSEPEYGLAELERRERFYELAMAFVAPFGDSTRVLIELGLADEQLELGVADGTRLRTDSSPGLFAAVGFRTRVKWFELGMRAAGQNFHGVRRQTHSADLRFHVAEHVALGLHYETWERDFRRTQRTGLGVQFKF